jgi:hypothetical protein
LYIDDVTAADDEAASLGARLAKPTHDMTSSQPKATSSAQTPPGIRYASAWSWHTPAPRHTHLHQLVF